MNEQNYVDEAEKVIKALKDKVGNNGRPIPMVTTSKIRNLLAMTADIYNEVINQSSEKLSSELCSRIEYLRIRFVYECGREPAVKNFVTEGRILEELKEIKGSKKKFILFNRYMESLVAYHKFYGGREQ